MKIAIINNLTGKPTQIKQINRLGEILPAADETLVLIDSCRDIKGIPDSILLESYGYDVATGKWSKLTSAMPLEEAKEAKLIELKGAFNSALKEGFTTSSSVKLDSDFESIAKLTSLMTFMQISGTPASCIRDFNNVTHDVTLAQLTGMLLELGVYTQELFQRKWDKQDLVNNATTSEEALAITW